MASRLTTLQSISDTLNPLDSTISKSALMLRRIGFQSAQIVASTLLPFCAIEVMLQGIVNYRTLENPGRVP